MIRPQIRNGVGFYQLRGDAHPIAALPDRTFEYVAYAQFAPDLSYVDRLTFVGEAGIPGYHVNPADTRKRCRDFVDHAVGEILLGRVPGHVLERQYCNRWLSLAGTDSMLSRNLGQLCRHLFKRHLLLAHGPEEANDGLHGKAKLGSQVGGPGFRFGERFGADPDLV